MFRILNLDPNKLIANNYPIPQLAKLPTEIQYCSKKTVMSARLSIPEGNDYSLWQAVHSTIPGHKAWHHAPMSLRRKHLILYSKILFRPSISSSKQLMPMPLMQYPQISCSQQMTAQSMQSSCSKSQSRPWRSFKVLFSEHRKRQHRGKMQECSPNSNPTCNHASWVSSTPSQYN